MVSIGHEPEMDMGHFFGPASNQTHLRLTRDPTRPDPAL